MASSYEVLFVLNKAALLLKKLASRGVAGNEQVNTVELACEGTDIHRSYLIANATKDRNNDLCNQLCS
jgi:hypothetical protein